MHEASEFVFHVNIGKENLVYFIDKDWRKRVLIDFIYGYKDFDFLFLFPYLVAGT